jgi:hypothetical protein
VLLLAMTKVLFQSWRRGDSVPGTDSFLEPVRALSKREKALVIVFLLTLPLVNPWVRGDGVGYYAYIHALLIRGDLHFENEWLAANPSFAAGRVDQSGHLRPDQYTPTGYVANAWSVGPSILWAPFLISVHAAVVLLNSLGANIAADGFSTPYVLTMALATAFYGFLGIFFSYQLAKSYFDESWAFLATLGIWFASALPVYMYFNPSWSHAHSAFAVSLFLWYWHRTRNARTRWQWILLGLLAGLMTNVYYPNAVLLLVPLLESLARCWEAIRQQPTGWSALRRLFVNNLVFVAVGGVAFLPTLISRKIIYGSEFHSGYYDLALWQWTRPVLWQVLFSSNHGLLAWTPVLIPAVLGLFLLRRHDKELATYLIVALLAFYYLIASYPTWHGIASFGNRFFVSLTSLFVLGLSASLHSLQGLFPRGKLAWTLARAVIAVFIVWNAGFIFQWGTHLVPARGPISWQEMMRNQVVVVPAKAAQAVSLYFLHRYALMRSIELKDQEQIEKRLVATAGKN